MLPLFYSLFLLKKIKLSSKIVYRNDIIKMRSRGYMVQSLVLSIICIVWGFALMIQARMEMKQPTKQEDDKEEKFSGRDRKSVV